MSYPRGTYGPNGKFYVATDLEAVKTFVYRLHDARGAVLYVGLSKNVPGRIKNHVRDAERGHFLKSQWVPRVRSLTMLGPFTWLDAVERERDEIERLQPEGNRMFTKRYGWRPRTEPHDPFADTA